MAEDKLKIRKQLKKSKPSFKRSQTNQFAKFKKDGWRKPKGMGNKLRRGRRGHQKSPTLGYGSPRDVKGLNHKGQLEITVKSLKDLESITKKEEVVLISSTVGKKKRLEILAEVKKKGISVSNIKDVDAAIKSYTKEAKVKKKVTKEVKEEKAEVSKDAKVETPKKEKPTTSKVEDKK